MRLLVVKLLRVRCMILSLPIFTSLNVGDEPTLLTRLFSLWKYKIDGIGLVCMVILTYKELLLGVFNY